MKPKIIFFGSDKYSVIVLEMLKKDKRFQILVAVTNKNSLEKLKSLKVRPEVGVLASFGAILDKKILAIPKHGILNIHPSLLPKYRGASPVQTAILNGEKETGVTIIKMDEKVDHGPILAQFKEEIKPDDTAQVLYERLFEAGAKVLTSILPAYLEGKIEPRQQDHSKATYTKKLTRDEGKIDWQKPDEYLERFIRAMYPWPGSWTEVELRIKNQESRIKRLKILRAHLENLSPDTCHLIPDLVQLEGKKPVTWKQFQEGYPEAKIIK